MIWLGKLLLVKWRVIQNTREKYRVELEELQIEKRLVHTYNTVLLYQSTQINRVLGRDVLGT
jgi:hypothetical protein